MTKISVIVPTFHRPDGLKSAIESIFAQKNAPTFEIIVIDNDENQSAKPVASDLKSKADKLGINLVYDVEPNAGVANARNHALKHANGEFIAFLDDDEVAFENWLFELFAAWENTKAFVVFGPIQARLLDGSDNPKEYFEDFFSRKLDGETRIIDKPYGCGNSFMWREKVLNSDAPFNIATNETGGEDDLLFREVVANGGKFAWAHNAWVFEDVPRRRATYNYLTPRAFAYGHNTTSQCFDAANPHYLDGVISMLRGLLQTLAMAPIAGLLFAIKHKKRAWAYDKMLRGLGKVLWFGPFKQSFYGQAAKKYLSL